jgi:hypothetical protein
MYQIAENDSNNAGDIFDLWSGAHRPNICGGDDAWHVVALGIGNARIMHFYMDGCLFSVNAPVTVNTSGTGTKLTVNNDGWDIDVADLAVFTSWIGKAKLDRLYAILADALD